MFLPSQTNHFSTIKEKVNRTWNLTHSRFIPMSTGTLVMCNCSTNGILFEDREKKKTYLRTVCGVISPVVSRRSAGEELCSCGPHGYYHYLHAPLGLTMLLNNTSTVDIGTNNCSPFKKINKLPSFFVLFCWFFWKLGDANNQDQKSKVHVWIICIYEYTCTEYSSSWLTAQAVSGSHRWCKGPCLPLMSVFGLRLLWEVRMKISYPWGHERI